MSSLPGTPYSAVNAPGWSRMPKVSSPGWSSATIAPLNEPTTSSPIRSMHPSGMTRSGTARSLRRRQNVAIHGANAAGGTSSS